VQATSSSQEESTMSAELSIAVFNSISVVVVYSAHMIRFRKYNEHPCQIGMHDSSNLCRRF